MTLPQSSDREPWFNKERRLWIAVVIGGVLLGFAGGNGHTTTGAIKHISAQVGCEHYLADQATKVAKQAIVSANSETVATPSAHDIPKDNCAR